jgi:hypothetical protein
VTLLVTLDFKKYGRQIPSTLLAIRHLFLKGDATKGLMTEFLDCDCGSTGYEWRTCFAHSIRHELALKAWEDDAFHATLSSLLKGQNKSSADAELLVYYASEKAVEEREDRWWLEGDDGGQPTICIWCADASNPTWKRSVLPAIRKWFKSDQFNSEYGARWGVALQLSGNLKARFC